jgi:aminoglycoside phosphotransferase (APT) family kinase protein
MCDAVDDFKAECGKLHGAEPFNWNKAERDEATAARSHRATQTQAGCGAPSRIRSSQSDLAHDFRRPVRVGPPYGLFAPYTAMPEFKSVSALADSRVAAQRVNLASDDLSILGAPFFLSQTVDGDTPLPWGAQSQKLEVERRQQQVKEFIGALAAPHVFDWRATALRRWGAGVTPESAALRQIDEWEAKFRRWALRSHPMAHRAAAWLRARAPQAERLSSVHGGHRLGNFLERHGAITAILDWELVHLGEPVEDLGWAFLP